MTTKRFLAAFFVAALLVAGVVSYYASANPDGLEYVAEETGFIDTAEDHAAGDGPMADYAIRGIDDPRVAGGLAGVVGVVATLVVAGGLTWAVRRRGGTTPEAPADDRQPQATE